LTLSLPSFLEDLIIFASLKQLNLTSTLGRK